MKKTGKGARHMKREDVFMRGVIAAVVILAVLLAVYALTNRDGESYVVTTEGHVHTESGEHVSSLEELYGVSVDEITVTEGGHIHMLDGTHLADLNELEIKNVSGGK